MATLSPTTLWRIYRRMGLPADATEREITVARTAFWAAILGYNKVLNRMLEEGNRRGALSAIRKLANATELLQKSHRGRAH